MLLRVASCALSLTISSSSIRILCLSRSRSSSSLPGSFRSCASRAACNSRSLPRTRISPDVSCARSLPLPLLVAQDAPSTSVSSDSSLASSACTFLAFSFVLPSLERLSSLLFLLLLLAFLFLVLSGTSAFSATTRPLSVSVSSEARSSCSDLVVFSRVARVARGIGLGVRKGTERPANGATGGEDIRSGWSDSERGKSEPGIVAAARRDCRRAGSGGGVRDGEREREPRMRRVKHA